MPTKKELEIELAEVQAELDAKKKEEKLALQKEKEKLAQGAGKKRSEVVTTFAREPRVRDIIIDIKKLERGNPNKKVVK